MIPPEVAALREILLKDPNVTNSQVQATQWAFRIIDKMREAGYMIENIDASAHQ